MTADRVILCGGMRYRGKTKTKPIRLNLWGNEQNVNLEISDITKRMADNIPTLFADLIEIATYIYCADQAVPRRNSVGNVGAKWRRPFRFFIPVRDPDFWSSQEVCPALQQTLGFLSDDTYVFEFSKLAGGDPITQYLKFGQEGDTGFNANEVVLFSGGLDSLAGAIQEAVVGKLSVALISHRSSPKVDPKQRNLVQELRRHCSGEELFHVPVWVQKMDKSLWREHTQRTRSFLYASIAATVARMFGLSRIRFYENGVTSLNFPISEQVIGSRASRTTHPRVLHDFAALFSKIAGGPFTVENPFFWKTKTEVVRSIGYAGCVVLPEIWTSE